MLQRADSCQVEMERKEARLVAEQEVIHIIVEEERSRLHNQKEVAINNLQEKIQNEFVDNEIMKQKREMA